MTISFTKPDVVVLQHDKKSSHVHLRGVYGDSGENEGVLSVSTVLDATENYPSSGLILVGSPKASPLIAGYLPDLGGFTTSIEGAGRLVSVLQDAIRDVRAGLAAASVPRACDHVFCDANGNRVYLYCQRGCGTRDPLEPASHFEPASGQTSVDALVDTAFDARKKIFEHVGYVEDWCVFPFDDSRDAFWTVDARERQWLKYSPQRAALAHWLEHDDFGSYGNVLYQDSIYTQRFLPKWVYRGPELTMVVADTHCDGNKFLRLLRTSNEVKPR